jgi:centrosomal CEP192-like protein
MVFPETPVGSRLAPATITVSNPTTSTILLEEIIVSGIDFAETTDCSKELAAGAKCSIQIAFQPATSGERIGNLVIAASDSNLPHFVPLTGIGE